MVDLVITAASVVPGTNATIKPGTAGATILAGQVVYRDSADTKLKLADSDHATAAVHDAVGIALNGASANQPVDYQTAGEITIGATMTAGNTYFLSNTAGGICPDADVGAGEEVIQIGIAKSTTVLVIDIQNVNVSR